LAQSSRAAPGRPLRLLFVAAASATLGERNRAVIQFLGKFKISSSLGQLVCNTILMPLFVYATPRRSDFED
jgi:hypothetical protein